MDFGDIQEDDSQSNHSNDSLRELGMQSNEGFFKTSEEPYAQQPTSRGLGKISQFVRTHHISLESFWKSNRNHANIDDIKQFCESVGMRLAPAD